MTTSTFTMRQLLEAGVHFGHHARRWNPKMAPYIYGVREGVHIVNLEHTVPMLNAALQAVKDVVAGGGRVLFVGTKRQASEKVAEAAKRCGQYYINHRWLGGMLTNWKTVSQSIKKLSDLEERLSKEDHGLTKKEVLTLQRQKDKLDRALGGIRDMGGVPEMMFIIDTTIEETAVLEARRLGIPIVAICDTNSDPSVVDFPVPGNDDSTRAIALYCDLVAKSVLDGLHVGLVSAGVDLGALENVSDVVDDKSSEEDDSSDKEEDSTEA